jgi:hypothetical protein
VLVSAALFCRFVEVKATSVFYHRMYTGSLGGEV